MEKTIYQKTILAIDASLGAASVAVRRGNATLAFLPEARPKEQAKQLVLLVEAALREAGLAYADLYEIACGVGPGTFTGLRIGLAAARGMGFASGIPVRGVTTFSAAATSAANADLEFLIALNAGKGEAYGQKFHVKHRLEAASEPFICAPESLAARTNAAPVWGNIPPDWATGLNFTPLLPDARHVAEVAMSYPHLLVEPEPFYIRAPDAKPMASGS